MALGILDVAPTVGEKGVVLLVGEKTSLISPLCTRLITEVIFKDENAILSIDIGNRNCKETFLIQIKCTFG